MRFSTRCMLLGGLPVSAALLGLGLVIGTRGLASPAPEELPRGFSYAVKFACVDEVGPAELAFEPTKGVIQ